MKHFKFILPLIFILFSCTTDSVQTPENTQLEITVLDDNDAPIDDSEVKLFSSQEDFDNDTNAIQTLNTNANGKVIFDNLQAIPYFVKITKSCYLNGFINTNQITNNILNQYSVNVVNNFNGDITIENNTVYECSFTLTGPTNNSYNILPGEQVILEDWVSGDYTYEYILIGGSATDISTFNLECGGFANVSIN